MTKNTYNKNLHWELINRLTKLKNPNVTNGCHTVKSIAGALLIQMRKKLTKVRIRE